MTLHQIAPQLSQQVRVEQNHVLKGFAVYLDAKRMGRVCAVLVDEADQLRYLIVAGGFWIFGRRVLLPADRTRIDDQARRIDLEEMSKQQVADLPEYQAAIGRGETSAMTIRRMSALEESMPLEAANLMAAAAIQRRARPTQTAIEPALLPAAQPDPPAAPVLPDRSEPPHETFKLYEERLVADKHVHTGEVNLYKRVETQTTRVVTPIAKERVVVARSDLGRQGQAASGARLQAGEVLRWEIYEETVEMQKQPVVREVVSIRKQTEQETVQIEELIRREVLDVQTQGHPIVETAQRSLSNPNASQ